MKRLCPPALGLCLLTVAACEITNPFEGVVLRLDVKGVAEIPESLGTMTVRSDRSTIRVGTAPNDTDVDRIEELRSLEFSPSFFSFTPGVPGGGLDRGALPTAASLDGTIRVFLFVGGVPVPGTPIIVTVVGGEVTAVDPQVIQISGATVDAAAVQAFLDSLPPEERPSLAGWESMTIDQVIAAINTALASSDIPLALGVEATGGLDGTLRLDQFEFDAEVVIGDGD